MLRLVDHVEVVLGPNVTQLILQKVCFVVKFIDLCKLFIVECFCLNQLLVKLLDFTLSLREVVARGIMLLFFQIQLSLLLVPGNLSFLYLIFPICNLQFFSLDVGL